MHATKLFNKSTGLKQSETQENTTSFHERRNWRKSEFNLQPCPGPALRLVPSPREKCEEKLHLASGSVWTKGDEIQSYLVLIEGLTLSGGVDGDDGKQCLHLFAVYYWIQPRMVICWVLDWKLWFMYFSGYKAFLLIDFQWDTHPTGTEECRKHFVFTANRHAKGT